MTDTHQAGAIPEQADESSGRRDLPAPVLLAALEDPESGLILFDERLRVMHATSLTRTLLQIRSEPPGLNPTLPELLRHSGLNAASIAAAKEMLMGFPGRDGGSETALLRNREEALCLEMRLQRLQPGYFAASFKASPQREAIPLGELAARDSLTGMATRPHFEGILQHAMQCSLPLAVLSINLDRFKAVNDTLGHAAGDSLLRLVAERLRSAVKETDTVARFAGDEFAVLAELSPSGKDPAELSRRLLDLVGRTYLIGGQLVHVGASIGIARFPEHGQDVKTLLQNSNMALHRSKKSGRGTFHLFDISMEQRAQSRRTNELELRRALALRQLEVFYQPQVDTARGRLVGFEALLRWRHPERGLLAPGMFLELAEEIGIIVPIGDWVLQTACREATGWPPEITVAVNASPLQFHTGRFGEEVRKALKSTGLPGERLEIEITEGILLDDNDVNRKTLDELRALNVRIAMDDFGTGYSSLSQLARFPFDKIKIDRSLAGVGGGDLKQRAIVRAITTLGANLGVCTLAEGVEDADQLARLKADGCSSVQGYFYGRPGPSSALDEIIARLGPSGGNEKFSGRD